MVISLRMFPVLFKIGGITISSFGALLALGVLIGIFLVWRLCRAWDLDEEKALDLILLTFLGGLIGSRIYFALEHWQVFSSSFIDLILINKTPGFSFWGGVLGGWLTMFIYAKRKNLDFWQVADIISVGFLGGLIFSSIGCFLGSCNIGIPSKDFFAVSQIGFIGKRWPVQALETLLLTISLLKVWSGALHFHQRGKIVAMTFIYIGIIKLALLPLRQDRNEIIFSLVLTLLGLTIWYRVVRQNPFKVLGLWFVSMIQFIFSSKKRKEGIQTLSKSWYNQKVNFSWKVKKVLRRFNVKFS